MSSPCTMCGGIGISFCRECDLYKGEYLRKSELENIKAEIETDLSMFCFDDWGNETTTWKEIKAIIDKHIRGEENTDGKC